MGHRQSFLAAKAGSDELDIQHGAPRASVGDTIILLFLQHKREVNPEYFLRKALGQPTTFAIMHFLSFLTNNNVKFTVGFVYAAGRRGGALFAWPIDFAVSFPNQPESRP